MIFYRSTLNTFLGKFQLIFCNSFLLYCGFDNKITQQINNMKISSDFSIKYSPRNIFVSQFKDYFEGRQNKFNLPFQFYGTKFQKDVWHSVYQIPYGKTASYSLIAEKIGNPGSKRAVGNALANNNLLILIPCHRVIRANGKLGNFKKGNKAKERLIQFEKNNLLL